MGENVLSSSQMPPLDDNTTLSFSSRLCASLYNTPPSLSLSPLSLSPFSLSPLLPLCLSSGSLPLLSVPRVVSQFLVFLYCKCLWRGLKFVVRKLTGRCELQRICYNNKPGACRTLKIGRPPSCLTGNTRSNITLRDSCVV